MMLIIPLPNTAQPMMMAMVMTPSHQQVCTLLTAEGARMRPMSMMMGPVTTGGKSFMTRLTPKAVIRPESTR